MEPVREGVAATARTGSPVPPTMRRFATSRNRATANRATRPARARHLPIPTRERSLDAVANAQAPGRAGAKKRGAPTENLSSAELLWLQSLEQPPVAAA